MNDNDAGEQGLAAAEETRAFETMAGYMAARPQRETMVLSLLVHFNDRSNNVFSTSGDRGQVYDEPMTKAFDIVDKIMKFSREHPPK